MIVLRKVIVIQRKLLPGNIK